MNVLSIENISKSFDHPVLKDVSFEVKAGSIYGLLGVNGAGKSTLFKIICGLLPLDSGKIMVDGEPMKRGSYGYMIEYPSFDEELSAFQNLYALSLLYEGISKERILSVLSVVGLEGKKDEKVRHYSLGMKQRLYFAYAIMNLSKILFLDEPFNGLDPVSVRDIEGFLKSFAEGGGIVLLSSHMIGEVEHLCSGVLILDEGKIVYNNPDIAKTDLRKAFFDSVGQSGEAQ